LHWCEAACRTLYGYELGDSIPLQSNDNLIVPSTSTLFKAIPTQVYICQNEDQELDTSILEDLKKISKKLALDKEKIVPVTWHEFFNNVLDDIYQKPDLLNALYDTQEEFYKEDICYRDLNHSDNKPDH